MIDYHRRRYSDFPQSLSGTELLSHLCLLVRGLPRLGMHRRLSIPRLKSVPLVQAILLALPFLLLMQQNLWPNTMKAMMIPIVTSAVTTESHITVVLSSLMPASILMARAERFSGLEVTGKGRPW